MIEKLEFTERIVPNQLIQELRNSIATITATTGVVFWGDVQPSQIGTKYIAVDIEDTPENRAAILSVIASHNYDAALLAETNEFLARLGTWEGIPAMSDVPKVMQNIGITVFFCDADNHLKIKVRRADGVYGILDLGEPVWEQ